MTNKERYLFLFMIIAVVLVTIFRSANASEWGHYYEPAAVYDIYPTLPGIDVRDYSRPGYRIEVDRFDNERAFPTLPGTSIRDYSQPGYRIDRR